MLLLNNNIVGFPFPFHTRPIHGVRQPVNTVCGYRPLSRHGGKLQNNTIILITNSHLF